MLERHHRQFFRRGPKHIHYDRHSLTRSGHLSCLADNSSRSDFAPIASGIGRQRCEMHRLERKCVAPRLRVPIMQSPVCRSSCASSSECKGEVVSIKCMNQACRADLAGVCSGSRARWDHHFVPTIAKDGENESLNKTFPTNCLLSHCSLWNRARHGLRANARSRRAAGTN